MTRAVLFSVARVLKATGGRAQNIADGDIVDVCIDSRAVKSGSLFVAIKGDRLDGHDFVASAIDNGALAALVSAARAKELAGLPLIIVPDALAGLAAIARAARRRSTATIIAITGSSGKTTTKDMIAAILRGAGETHASKRSYNNQWGVPLTLANLSQTARFGVFEIGMNHPGEIEPLARLVRPHVALVTNVGAAHIGNFGTVEAIAEAKAEIFAGLEAGGVAVLNADCARKSLLTAAAKSRGIEVTSFGFAPDADVRITDYEDRETGSCAHITLDGQRFELKLAVSGAHMMANAVAALCAARQSGIGLEQSAAALAGFRAAKGRGAVCRLGPDDNPLTLIDESYNANPASMRAALAVFARMAAGDGRKKFWFWGTCLNWVTNPKPCTLSCAPMCWPRARTGFFWWVDIWLGWRPGFRARSLLAARPRPAGKLRMSWWKALLVATWLWSKGPTVSGWSGLCGPYRTGSAGGGWIERRDQIEIHVVFS